MRLEELGSGNLYVVCFFLQFDELHMTQCVKVCSLVQRPMEVLDATPYGAGRDLKHKWAAPLLYKNYASVLSTVLQGRWGSYA